MSKTIQNIILLQFCQIFLFEFQTYIKFYVKANIYSYFCIERELSVGSDGLSENMNSLVWETSPGVILTLIMRILFTAVITETLQRKGPPRACGKMRLYTRRPWCIVKCKMPYLTVAIFDLTELSFVFYETVLWRNWKWSKHSVFSGMCRLSVQVDLYLNLHFYWPVCCIGPRDIVD